MKEFVRTLLLTMIVCCWSCSDGGEDLPTPSPKPETSKIEISSSVPVVEQKGGTATITFTTNAAWTASIGSSTSWAKVSPASGTAGTHTLYVTTEANDTFDERNAILTIKAGNTSRSVTITQKQKDALIVTSNKVEIGSNGGDFSIEAKANVSVSYEIEESAKDWISAIESRALTTKALYFTAKANESMERRQGNIILKGGDGLSETITVYQEGEKPTLVITSDDIIVGSDGETIKIELKSNVEYTMVMPEVDWISKEESRAISAYTHYLTIAPNETYDQRNAVVYFQSETENLKDSISITQLQKDAIIVAKNEYTIGAIGGNLDFVINSNVDFTVEISIDWIMQNIEGRGLEAKPLSFTIAENKSDKSREGVITISFGNLKQEIKVVQKASSEEELFSALSSIYQKTGGDTWNNNYLWLSEQPLTKWYGINPNNPELDFIHTIDLSWNNLKGNIPDEVTILMDKVTNLSFSGNLLTGKIPDVIKEHYRWTEIGWHFLHQNQHSGGGFDLTDSNLYPENQLVHTIMDDTEIQLFDLFKGNKLTQVIFYNSHMGGIGFDNERVNRHLDYQNKGLGTLIFMGSENEGVKNYIETNYGNLEGVLWVYGNLAMPTYTFDASYFFNNKGELVGFNVYSSCLDNTPIIENEKALLKAYLGEPDTDHPKFELGRYTSSDYSRDGEVFTIQTASLGKGIDIVLLGEGFTDKDMNENGLYEQKMQNAAEKIFELEPYKSFRNRFNVYGVKAVSPHAEFTTDATNRFEEDYAVAFEYARKTGVQLPLVAVIYNTESYVGRSYCNMFSDGSSVVFNMNKIDDTLIHEICGHGFANLLDEYVERGNEKLLLPEDMQSYLDNVWTNYLWGANVDWRNNASTVKWSHFLNDARYADDGLGLYEGAYLYGHGAYRPTENSMMRYNDSPFNAPSREQIYKRIMQRSEGEGWKYDYEEFVKYDEINRNTASRSAIKPLTESERREYIKNHRPPTFIKGTWRDAMKGKSQILVPLR